MIEEMYGSTGGGMEWGGSEGWKGGAVLKHGGMERKKIDGGELCEGEIMYAVDEWKLMIRQGEEGKEEEELQEEEEEEEREEEDKKEGKNGVGKHDNDGAEKEEEETWKHGRTVSRKPVGSLRVSLLLKI